MNILYVKVLILIRTFFAVLYKQLYEEEDFTTIQDRSTETFSIPNKRDSRVYSVGFILDQLYKPFLAARYIVQIRFQIIECV